MRGHSRVLRRAWHRRIWIHRRFARRRRGLEVRLRDLRRKSVAVTAARDAPTANANTRVLLIDRRRLVHPGHHGDGGLPKRDANKQRPPGMHSPAALMTANCECASLPASAPPIRKLAASNARLGSRLGARGRRSNQGSGRNGTSATVAGGGGRSTAAGDRRTARGTRRTAGGLRCTTSPHGSTHPPRRTARATRCAAALRRTARTLNFAAAANPVTATVAIPRGRHVAHGQGQQSGQREQNAPSHGFSTPRYSEPQNGRSPHGTQQHIWAYVGDFRSRNQGWRHRNFPNGKRLETAQFR